MHYQRHKLSLHPFVATHFKHHGHTYTPEWHSWVGMKRRCYSKSFPKYPDYGGRGITVCERWRDKLYGFTNFLSDMGYRPSAKHSLNRIDNNGNYEPGNCEWATLHQQAGNRRNSLKTPGVYYDNRLKNKWCVRLYLNKAIVFYQRFSTEEEAIAARKAAEKKYL